MKNKRLQKFLLLLVVSIWGMVAVRVFGSMSSGDRDEAKSDFPSAGSHTKRAAFVYTADVRDPFYFPLNISHRDSTRHQLAAPKLVWMPPPLKLTGILQSKARKKTVILENATGSVFFLSEGDTLSGTRILAIGRNEVSYLFQKKKSVWTLEAQ